MAPRHFTRIVAVLFLVVSFNANAEWQAQFTFGPEYYEEPPCSLWHHKCNGSPTKMDARTSGYSVGAEYRIRSDNWFNGDGINVEYQAGTTYGHSAEACDDEGWALAGNKGCPVDTDMYYGTGSIRSVTIGYRARFGSVFGFGLPFKLVATAGAGRFRQSFSMQKDDGWRFSGTAHGFGGTFGGGIEFKNNISLNAYKHSTKIGSGDSETPPGAGGKWFIGLRVQR